MWITSPGAAWQCTTTTYTSLVERSDSGSPIVSTLNTPCLSLAESKRVNSSFSIVMMDAVGLSEHSSVKLQMSLNRIVTSNAAAQVMQTHKKQGSYTVVPVQSILYLLSGLMQCSCATSTSRMPSTLSMHAVLLCVWLTQLKHRH